MRTLINLLHLCDPEFLHILPENRSCFSSSGQLLCSFLSWGKSRHGLSAGGYRLEQKCG